MWKESTSFTTEHLIEKYILGELGPRQIASITRKDLQAHLDAKAAAGLSASIVGHVRWQLVVIFEMALSDSIVTVNPAAALVMPKIGQQPDRAVIDRDAIHRAQMVLEIRERLMFRLAVYEGMRPGEITGLQIGALRDGMIHVARRIYRGKVDSPKSWRSRRAVPATKITQAVLAQWIELLQNREADAWLFPSENVASPVSYAKVYQKHIRPALKTVGLEHATFQVLRRTWVTELSETEKDPGVRAQLAGHSTGVNENVYRQSRVETLKRSMKKFEKRLQ